jgi:hypothetical protein
LFFDSLEQPHAALVLSALALPLLNAATRPEAVRFE